MKPCIFAALAATSLLALPLAAQGKNCALLSQPNPGGGFNDIWGHVDPATGKEYAFLLGRASTFCYDIANPGAPVLRGTIAGSLSGWSASTWRDARTYAGYLYVVTEGGGGMQIIDIRNPDAPVFLKTFTLPNWRNTHNIAMDTENGVAYPCGATSTAGGMPIIDVKTDPQNPKLITQYSTQYVHDLHIQNGIAHLAEINRSTYRLLDVSNLPSLVSRGTYSVPSCHNAWPQNDDMIAVTTSERSGGGVTIFDVSNPAAPKLLSTFQVGGSATSVHNAYVKDGLVHMAHYSEGYRCIDISDPTKPVEVAYYDTNTCTQTYCGNWGCFPFLPSGNVLASDMTYGLFVLKPKATATRYGLGTAGTGGKTPRGAPFGAAFLGNPNFALEVENARPNSPALVIVSTQRANVPIGGLTLLVDVIAAPNLVFNGTTDARGRMRIKAPVPTDNGFDGLVLRMQGIVADPNGPIGASATEGIEFMVFKN